MLSRAVIDITERAERGRWGRWLHARYNDNLRQIARQFGLVHQTVATWMAAHADALPARPPQPQGVETAARDELYTFVGDKKTPVTS